MDEYKNLANGIIEQACKDYMWSIRYIEKHDHPGLTLKSAVRTNIAKAKVLKRDCENFFRSGYFMLLSGIDGEKIIEHLKRKPIGEYITCTRFKYK